MIPYLSALQIIPDFKRLGCVFLPAPAWWFAFLQSVCTPGPIPEGGSRGSLVLQRGRSLGAVLILVPNWHLGRGQFFFTLACAVPHQPRSAPGQHHRCWERAPKHSGHTAQAQGAGGMGTPRAPRQGSVAAGDLPLKHRGWARVAEGLDHRGTCFSGRWLVKVW